MTDLHGLSRHEDPGTSHAAGLSVDAGALIERIYRVMLGFGERGCIADDVEDALPDLRSHSITPRFRQMIERGMIHVTGETRRARSGRMQLVRRALTPPFIAQPKRGKTALDLPEPRRSTAFDKNYTHGYNDGWNACLDAVRARNTGK